MTPTTAPSAPPLFDAATLSHLAGRPGPCLTVLLPACSPGSGSGERHTVLESLFHTLPAPDAVQLLGRIEDALAAHGLNGGGPGLAIVAGSGYLEIYRAPVPAPQIEQDSYPFVLPLLPDALAPHDFFVLELSEKQLRLMHYLHGELTPLELPGTMAASLEQFRHREDHGDQNRENRTSTGSVPGTIGARRFGTLSEREDASLHRERFFARADDSLAALLGPRLLLLMGVDEEVAAFRRVAKHCQMFAEQIPHPAVRHLPLREIAQRASECALSHGRARGTGALNEIREKADRRLTLAGNEAILEAARAGRVHLVCIPEAAGASRDEQLLWNAAAIETLRHRGEVLVAGDTRELAALLRY